MLYDKYAHAWDTQDIDMLENLCHPDFEMVMHSSGSVASKSEYIDRVGSPTTHTHTHTHSPLCPLPF